MTALAGLRPDHFLWHVENRVATIRLNRPERKNPLTFESYAELRDTFRALPDEAKQGLDTAKARALLLEHPERPPRHAPQLA